MTFAQAKHQVHSSINEVVGNATMLADGSNSVLLEIPNDFGHHALVFQITSNPSAGDYTFQISYDHNNFIPVRVWDCAALTHTTAVSGVIMNIYSVYTSGARAFRITKLGAPANITGVIYYRQHKTANSHFQRTQH